MMRIGLNKEVVVEGFLQRMNRMRKENPPDSSCDVTFEVEGKEFHCHKGVMGLASPYFEVMFNGAYRESHAAGQKIVLKNLESESFEEILSAIYTNRFHLHRRNAYFILQASHMLLLTNIFEAAVQYITDDTGVDYLIETCLFAKEVEQSDLYNACITAIASDLNDFSKTFAFNTKITYGVFKDILSDDNLIYDDGTLLHIITKWCNSNECTEEEVLHLLNSANVRSGCLRSPMMAKFIVNSHNEQDEKGSDSTTMIETSPQSASDASSSYNVYLNTVDAETGAKGWAILRSKNVNKFQVAYNLQSNPGFRKVKQVGNKLYCYEHDDRENRNYFYYFENCIKKYLDLPMDTPTTDSDRYFDMEAVDDFIYLITPLGILHKYDCERDFWDTLLLEDCTESSQNTSRPCSKRRPSIEFEIANTTPKLTSDGNNLYIIGANGWDIITVKPNDETSYKNHKGDWHKAVNPAVCCYDNKLVVSGSMHKTVSVYDLLADKWYKLKDMNTRRANHSMTFHNGFLYVMENRPMVLNEKYDIKQGKWINFPSLPEQISIYRNRKRINLATCDVFNFSIKR